MAVKYSSYELKLCKSLSQKKRFFWGMSGKREIYLHNSEKSCTFAAESCKELVIWTLKS